MKTLKQIELDLIALEKVFGFNPMDIEQNSPEWFTMKLGVMSASNADCLLSGKTTAKRKTYMLELVAQIATGSHSDVKAKQLEWGHDHEDSARAAYEELNRGITVTQFPFIYKDEKMRAGCSVDGIFDSESGLQTGQSRLLIDHVKIDKKGFHPTVVNDGGTEIKCPYSTKNHIEFLCLDYIKPEYKKQVQFTMWVTEREFWDFVSYDPRMLTSSIKIKRIEKDEKMHALFEEAVPEMANEVDKLLAKIDMKFGEQWGSSYEL